MKKQTLVAGLGTLALAANVLLPSLALGQGSDPQAAEQDIACGSLTLNVNADNDFQMTDLNVSTSAQDSFAALTGSGFAVTYQSGTNALPVESFVSVDDARTVGSGAGCATDGTDEGWTLSAAATDFVDGLNSIPNTNFYIATSPNVTAAGGFTEYEVVDGDDENVYYTTGYAGTQDVAAQYNLASTTDLTTATPFTTENASLDTARNILNNATGAGTNDFKFTSVGTGLAYYLNVPANQSGGTYSSTVTLTLATAT